jgi:hypothetical protein
MWLLVIVAQLDVVLGLLEAQRLGNAHCSTLTVRLSQLEFYRHAIQW